MTESERRAARTLRLLDALEAAEKEWGDRLQTAVEKEASFLEKVLSTRVGSAAAASRVQEALADLTVGVIEDFLKGDEP